MSYWKRTRRWITVFTALLSLTVGGLLADSAHAQQPTTPIAAGETAEGEITSSAYQVLYSYMATAKESVTITMRGGGGLDSYLILKDASGKTLAEDDDSGGAGDALLKYTFTEDGEYTIVATRPGQQGGQSTGSFKLTVESSKGSAATAKATRQGTAVAGRITSTPGGTEAATGAATEATTEATTEAVTEAATTAATTAATSAVTTRATRTPRATATQAATEAAGGATTAATAGATSAATSRPTRTPRPTLTRRPPTITPTPSPIVNAGDIGDGSTVTGEITDTQIFWVYTFDGAVADQLSITMQGEGGLVPSVAVIPSQNQQSALKVVNAKAGTSQVQLQVTLPTNDTYFIVATRAGGDSGTSTGKFTLTMAVATLPAEVQTTGQPAQVLANLVSDNLAPKGGKLLFRIPSIVIRDSSAPGKSQPVGVGFQAKDFVLQYQVSWTTAGETSACGISFRKSGNRDLSFVVLTNDQKVAVVQRQGNRALINFFQDSQNFTPKKPNTVTVIAVGDKVTVYVNGLFQASETGKGVRGSFEANVFNVEGNTTVTNCTFQQGWVWSLDIPAK